MKLGISLAMTRIGVVSSTLPEGAILFDGFALMIDGFYVSMN